MKRLSGSDQVFLSLETPDWHQHIAGMTVLDPSSEDEFTFETAVARLEERLELAPKFKWKLKQVPLGLDRPGWVEDDLITSGDYPYEDRLKRKHYEEELEALQLELVKMQAWQVRRVKISLPALEVEVAEIPVAPLDEQRRIVWTDWGGGNVMTLSSKETRGPFQPPPPAVVCSITPGNI